MQTGKGASWTSAWLTTDAAAVGWTPLELANLEFWLPTHYLRSMWLPVSNVALDTPATMSGQLIAQVDEQGPSSHRITSPNGREASLGSDVGGRSYLTFTPNEYLRVQNSQGAFKWLHNGTAFSILVWLRIAPGASTGAILDNSRATSLGTTGITLQYNGSGSLFFTIARQVSGNAIQHTSTATVSSADGWVLVLCAYDGVSLAAMRIFSNGGENELATEVMSVAGGFDTGDATDDLHIGVRSAIVSTGFNGDIGDVIFTSGIIEEPELDRLRTWQPQPTDANGGRVLGSYAALGPAAVSGLSEWHDFGNRTTQWQDNVGGTSVTSEDDPVGVIENDLSATSGVDLKRNFAYDGTASERPLSKDATTNGSNRPAAFFDGAMGSPDDELTGPGQPTGGASTWIYVARNLDTDNGSHFSRASGNQYLVKTGSEYLSGSGNDMRIVVHTSGAIAPNNQFPFFGKESGVGDAMPGGGEVWEIITVRRNGKEWTLRWNGVPSETTFLNDGAFELWRIGPSVNPLFECDGYIGCRLRYTRALTDSEVAIVEAGLADEWGITLLSP